MTLPGLGSRPDVLWIKVLAPSGPQCIGVHVLAKRSRSGTCKLFSVNKTTRPGWPKQHVRASLFSLHGRPFFSILKRWLLFFVLKDGPCFFTKAAYVSVKRAAPFLLQGTCFTKRKPLFRYNAPLCLFKWAAFVFSKNGKRVKGDVYSASYFLDDEI